MESHKDRMKWLKKHDPITYYELTSNPTGSHGGGDLGLLIPFIVVGLIILGMSIFGK